MEADEGGGGVELVALPRLACRVDVAMCRFLLDVALSPSSSDAVGESAQPPKMMMWNMMMTDWEVEGRCRSTTRTRELEG